MGGQDKVNNVRRRFLSLKISMFMHLPNCLVVYILLFIEFRLSGWISELQGGGLSGLLGFQHPQTGLSTEQRPQHSCLIYKKPRLTHSILKHDGAVSFELGFPILPRTAAPGP